MKDKAQLHLSKKLDANALAKLFEKLTGRKPTPAEIEDARKKLEAK